MLKANAENLQRIALTPPKDPCKHRYFVASTVGVPSEGTVFVIIVCTACADAHCEGFKVSSGGSQLLIEEPTERK